MSSSWRGAKSVLQMRLPVPAFSCQDSHKQWLVFNVSLPLLGGIQRKDTFGKYQETCLFQGRFQGLKDRGPGKFPLENEPTDVSDRFISPAPQSGFQGGHAAAVAGFSCAWGGHCWWDSVTSLQLISHFVVACSREVSGRTVLNLNGLAQTSCRREGSYGEVFLLTVAPGWGCGSSTGNFAEQYMAVCIILGTPEWLGIPAVLKCVLIPTFCFPQKKPWIPLFSWNKSRCLLSSCAIFVSAASPSNLFHMFITLQLKQFCLTTSLFTPSCFIWNVCSLVQHSFPSFPPGPPPCLGRSYLDHSLSWSWKSSIRSPRSIVFSSENKHNMLSVHPPNNFGLGKSQDLVSLFVALLLHPLRQWYSCCDIAANTEHLLSLHLQNKPLISSCYCCISANTSLYPVSLFFFFFLHFFLTSCHILVALIISFSTALLKILCLYYLSCHYCT